MSENSSHSVARIRHLNDAFRRTFVGGAVVVTAGVEALPTAKRKAILAKVQGFDAFPEDNDPHGEHDFGVIEEGGVRSSGRSTTTTAKWS